jgi:hypothetical protein
MELASLSLVALVDSVRWTAQKPEADVREWLAAARTLDIRLRKQTAKARAAAKVKSAKRQAHTTNGQGAAKLGAKNKRPRTKQSASSIPSGSTSSTESRRSPTRKGRLLGGGAYDAPGGSHSPRRPVDGELAKIIGPVQNYEEGW